MNAHRVETIVNPDGSLLLKDIPFQPGEQVEVIIIERPLSKRAEENRYPLRGQPLQFNEPCEPVAEAEWGALQ